MDHRSFDRMVRLLGGTTSRRTALRSVFAAALGGGAVSGAEAKSAQSGRHDRPDAQGVCGKGKANRCRKNSDCCTNFCDKPKGRPGRCRCIRENQPCTKKQTCCKGLACTDGTCGSKNPPPPATIDNGDPCVADDVCTDANASCTTYSLGVKVGTYCILPSTKSCGDDDDCVSSFCNGGTCAAACTVCASGCPYTTINDAYNAAASGDVIGIAPGAYDEYLAPTFALTLRRCGSEGVVDWNDTTYGYGTLRLYEIDDTVTVEDIEFNGTGNTDAGALVWL
ncbi:MAG: hypothetical protein ACR2J8_03095, partial [Thermomicrobiales bacterium]